MYTYLLVSIQLVTHRCFKYVSPNHRAPQCPPDDPLHAGQHAPCSREWGWGCPAGPPDLRSLTAALCLWRRRDRGSQGRCWGARGRPDHPALLFLCHAPSPAPLLHGLQVHGFHGRGSGGWGDGSHHRGSWPVPGSHFQLHEQLFNAAASAPAAGPSPTAYGNGQIRLVICALEGAN